MPNLVDINLLKQVTVDAMLVYEAGCGSRELLDESRQALDAAEGLLSQVKALMLSEQTLVVDQMNKIPSRQALLENYVEIQRGYALFKDALYNLVQSAAAAKRWSDAYFAAQALMKLDPDYLQIGNQLPKILSFHNLLVDLDQGRYDKVIYEVEKSSATPNSNREFYIDLLCEANFRVFMERQGSHNYTYFRLKAEMVVFEGNYLRDCISNWNALRRQIDRVEQNSILAAYITLSSYMKLGIPTSGYLCRFLIPDINLLPGQTIGIIIQATNAS